MSAENVELVRRWFDGFAAGELSPELCDPEIEIRNWAESPAPGPYRGHEGLQRWWNDIHDRDAAADLSWFQVEEIIDVDHERVMVVQRATGHGRYTGLELDHLWAAVITIRGGKIAAAVGHSNPDEAKRAAGLPAPP
jgi:ketosteroid isomerase-like protein